MSEISGVNRKSTEFGPVVQLVRTPPCHGGGHEFESRSDRQNADLAHLVERHLAKVEVASSSLVIRSINKSHCVNAAAFLFSTHNCFRKEDQRRTVFAVFCEA